jgi:hypothetical protein
MWLGLGGSVTVAVHGRRSGKLRKIPVLPVEYEDARYLVSTRGESEWVKNLRAVGGKGELTVGGKTDPFQATEVPVGERGVDHRRLPNAGRKTRELVLHAIA